MKRVRAPLFLMSNPVSAISTLQPHGYAIYGPALPRKRVEVSFENVTECSTKIAEQRLFYKKGFVIALNARLTFQCENISIGVPDDRKLLRTDDLENVQAAREDED